MRVAAVAAASALILAVVVLLVASLTDRLFAPAIRIEPLHEGAIVVAVEGAVASPGVVELPVGARIDDAIRATGGVTDVADLSGINKAARLHDGERVVIPAQAAAVASGDASPTASLIDINTASAAILDTLPGIGETLSQRIVEYREIHGPFTSVDDLLEVEGISESTLDGIRDLVTLGG
jgi:competence protein ComEA